MKLRYLIFFLILLFASCYREEQKPPSVNSGILDLTRWNLTEKGTVKLDGDWEFYWHELYSPDDFKNPANIDKKSYFKVSNLWNNAKDSLISPFGYATYKLSINLNENEEEKLALRVPTFATSCKLFVNGTEIAEIGKVGKNKENSAPAYIPQVIEFQIDTSQIEIIMQISNYFHRKGGTWHSITLGTEKQLRNARENKVITDLFLFGSIFIISLYHFALFSLRRKEKMTLYFAIFSFFIALRILTTGEYLLGKIDFFNWTQIIKIEYLTFYLGGLFFTAFMKALYPEEYSKKILYFMIIIASIFAIKVLISVYPIIQENFKIVYQGIKINIY